MPFFVRRMMEGEATLNKVPGDTLRIGRGTDVQLFLDDNAVEYDHAVIRQDAAGFELIDRGSRTGSWVNGERVQARRLTSGDLLLIGDYQIRFQQATAEDMPILQVELLEAEPEEGAVPVEAPKIDYPVALELTRGPLRKWLVAAALTAITVAALWALWVSQNYNPLRPGALSEAHATLRTPEAVAEFADCSACHTPWRKVANEGCETCHLGPQHQPRQARDPGCYECHPEHREVPRLVAVQDRLCVDCHGDLAVSEGQPRFAASISSFDDHPDFRPRTDDGTVPLNHRLHLAPGLPRPAGVEALACDSCHRYDDVTGGMQPIAFEQHCQGCHTLHFDAAFPRLEAPHGEPELVFEAVFGAYSGVSLDGLTPEQARQRLFRRGGSERSLDQRAFNAVDQLFRVACVQCHGVTMQGVARATVDPVPRIPDRWLEYAEFSHRPHPFACEGCHAAAADSAASSDLLLPGIEVCRQCHAGSQEAAAAPEQRAASTCATCHNYHPRDEAWRTVLTMLEVADARPDLPASTAALHGPVTPGRMR